MKQKSVDQKLDALRNYNPGDRGLLKKLVELVAPCPCCGQRMFIRIEARTTIVGKSSGGIVALGRSREKEYGWCWGPYTIACGFRGCGGLGSTHKFYSFIEMIRWWNRLPRKEDYGETFESKTVQKNKVT